MARLLMNESWVLNRMRLHDEAIDKCTRALHLFESQETSEDRAQAHNNLAVFYESKGDLDLALEHNEKSMALFSSLNNRQKVANIYLSLGYLYDKRKEPDTALDYFEQSVTTMGKMGNRYGMGTALMAKGRCYMDMGRLDEAESVLCQSLRIHQELNLKLKIVANELALANLHMEKEDAESAKKYLADARQIAAAENNESDLAKISRLEAELVAQENPDSRQTQVTPAAAPDRQG